MPPQEPLADFRIPNLPDTAYYFPAFLTTEQEEFILLEITKLPLTKWTNLSRRRLLSLPSVLTGANKDTLLDTPMPSFLTKTILDKFAELQLFADSKHGAPNHCLVNEYLPGQGIMPHEDGLSYFPLTATVSLGSHTVLNIYEKNEAGERAKGPAWRILQEPRSLLVTTGNMYTETLHGIEEVEEDIDLAPDTIVNWELLADPDTFNSGTAQRQKRISLTYRDVVKVAKVGGALRFMNKR